MSVNPANSARLLAPDCATYAVPTQSWSLRGSGAAVGVVAQTPRNVAANFYLHTRLAEVDVAVTAQLKAHRVLHNPMKPLRIADKKVRRSEAIREVGGE
jgi:hypothetical protein